MPPLRRPFTGQPSVAGLSGSATGGSPPMPGAIAPPLAGRMPGRPALAMGGNGVPGRPTGMKPGGGPVTEPEPVPPVQPNAGGPTSPLNIGQMLQPNQQPPVATNAPPLSPWGDGTPQAHAQEQTQDGTGEANGVDLPGGDGTNGFGMPGQGPQQQGQQPPGGGANPMLMVKLMKLMGHL